ncbi:hypothetical protein DK871_21965 [Pseudomonas sp. L13]|nr:hypothetical protein [Pseudomonas sp. L13]
MKGNWIASDKNHIIFIDVHASYQVAAVVIKATAFEASDFFVQLIYYKIFFGIIGKILIKPFDIIRQIRGNQVHFAAVSYKSLQKSSRYDPLRAIF